MALRAVAGIGPVALKGMAVITIYAPVVHMQAVRGGEAFVLGPVVVALAAHFVERALELVAEFALEIHAGGSGAQFLVACAAGQGLLLRLDAVVERLGCMKGDNRPVSGQTEFVVVCSLIG